MTILSNDWDEPFEGEIPETDADLCRAMWIAVILQALLDAKSNSLKKCLQKKRAEAREWLGLDWQARFRRLQIRLRSGGHRHRKNEPRDSTRLG